VEDAEEGLVIALMRFLTRERIGFQVSGIDARTRGGQPRCTRWWRIWPATRVGPFAVREARAVVDFQHDTTLGPPYWQARIRVGHVGFEVHTGPWLVNR
jgi:hypothetical protein